MKPENVVDVLFGNRLRQLLDERNISQAHFADRIGVSRSRMNNYDRGSDQFCTRGISASTGNPFARRVVRVIYG